MSYLINFTHLKVCLGTATHNFKWVQITYIWLVWDQTLKIFARLITQISGGGVMQAVFLVRDRLLEGLFQKWMGKKKVVNLPKTPKKVVKLHRTAQKSSQIAQDGQKSISPSIWFLAD